MRASAHVRRTRAIWSGASLAALLIAGQAAAQDARPQGADGEPRSAAQDSAAASAETGDRPQTTPETLDAARAQDIVVTATRRETNLMTTPVAVTAVTGDALVKQNITSAAGLEKVVPGLKIQDSSTLGMGALQLTMRGIGNSNYTEQGDPNVGLHVDGVYSSRPQAAWNLIFDVDRVEVLRGPQGTLFGRNSTVGSINIITTKPRLGESEGRAEVQYGRFDDVQLRGAFNLPIGDTLAVRFTGFYGKRDSFCRLRLDPTLGTTGQQNPYLLLGDPTDRSDGAGSLDHKAFRVSALWEPVENGSLYFAWEKYINDSPAAPLTVPQAKYEAYLNAPNYTEMRIDSIRAQAQYEIADAVDVKYTFGRQRYEHEILLDLDAGISRYRPPNAPGTDQQFFWDRPFRTRSRSHERITAVTLTGSEEAGAKVAEAAGRALKKVVLELGGSDPFVVMPSADLDAAAKAAVAARIQNAGQSCICTKRMIVHDVVYDDFVRRFTEGMRAVKVGDPREEVDMGPLSSGEQRDTVLEQLGRIRTAGGRLDGGEALPGPGAFMSAGVVTDLPPDAEVAREELFGPVATVFRAANLEDAIRIANDTPFGLGSSVWTEDEAERERFARDLEVGMVAVNRMLASTPEAPFGGVKRSGHGRELGPYGLHEFMNLKTVFLPG